MAPTRLVGMSAVVGVGLLAAWFAIRATPPRWLAQAARTSAAQPADRPAIRNRVAHGPQAQPNYARLFSLDRVHEIQITIAPDRFRLMQEDLKEVTANSPMGRAGGGPGRGGPGGPGGRGGMADMERMMAEAVKSCEGKPASASCSAEPMGAGKCLDMFDFGQLMCIPDAFARLGRGAAIRLTSRDPIDIPVTVTFDGEMWTQVGMRFKGNSSLTSTVASGNGKVPFRLDFNHFENGDATFHGFRKLTFSSNFGDDSQLHDTLANEILRDRGAPAPRTAFYRVVVDSGAGPEYWGLYTMIEDPADGAMLGAQFGGADGNLYKPDGEGADWTTFTREGFGRKTRKDIDDYSDVQAAVQALNTPRDNPAAWRAALEATFNVDGFLLYLAVNTAIQDWDQYGAMAHNYYLYGDPGRGGQLQWISWDHNFAFGAGPMGGGPPGRGGPGGVGRGAPAGGPGPPGPGPGVVGRGGRGRGFGQGIDILAENVSQSWPLISRLMADPVYSARYRELLVHALGGLHEPAAFEKRARELHALIASSVVGQAGERLTHTTISSPQAFEDSLDGPTGLLQQVRTRHAAIRAALAGASAR